MVVKNPLKALPFFGVFAVAVFVSIAGGCDGHSDGVIETDESAFTDPELNAAADEDYDPIMDDAEGSATEGG